MFNDQLGNPKNPLPPQPKKVVKYRVFFSDKPFFSPGHEQVETRTRRGLINDKAFVALLSLAVQKG